MKNEEKRHLDKLLFRFYKRDIVQAEKFLESRGEISSYIPDEGREEVRKDLKGSQKPTGFPVLLLQRAALIILVFFCFQGVALEKYHKSPLSLRISELAGDKEIQRWIKYDLPRELDRLIRFSGEEERNE